MTTATVIRQLTLGHDVCDWIETHCVYPSGELMRQPFKLLPWQRDWICELYRCDRDSQLQYRWALLGIPKKAGKSTLVAALGLYHLLGDPNEIDPWVVVAAASDKQADIVFDAAKRMCEYSPSLREATERWRWEIRPKDGTGKMERVAAAAGRLDGKNISFLIIDELHEWNQENWTILTNGTVGRRRAQIVQITTAGWDRESVCYVEYEKGLRIAAGEVQNPSYFFRWYGLPEGADYRNEALWPAMNPSFGVLVYPEQLRDKLLNVPESDWRRYFGNQWVESENLWLPYGTWDACNIGAFDLEPKAATFVGWDGSTKYDSTALLVGQRHEGKTRIKAKVWERPIGANGVPIEDWSIPGAEISEYLRDLWRNKLNVVAIAFDPAFITWLAQDLGNEGLPMIEFPQSDTKMVPATQAVYELVVKGEIEHDGDPVLARHIRNALAVQSYRGGQRIAKKKSRQHVDAAVALLMMVQTMREYEETPHGISLYIPGDIKLGVWMGDRLIAERESLELAHELLRAAGVNIDSRGADEWCGLWATPGGEPLDMICAHGDSYVRRVEKK